MALTLLDSFELEETKLAPRRNHREVLEAHAPAAISTSEGRDMTALAARFFPNASAESVAEFETLASVALFCGVGLLVSVSVLLLDKYIPGEWF